MNPRPIEDLQSLVLETFNHYAGAKRQAQGITSTLSQCWPRIITAVSELRAIGLVIQEDFLLRKSVAKGEQRDQQDNSWFFEELFTATVAETSVVATKAEA